MRPLGHDGTREGRDAYHDSLDERLQETWEGYLSAINRHTHSWGHIHSRAIECLASLRPPLHALHAHIIHTSQDDAFISAALGIFVSAGYQQLPQKRIVYDLVTPKLEFFGLFLKHKHLIIDGVVGAGAGQWMVGHLTNNGTIGEYAGFEMIGTFRNNGSAGQMPGYAVTGYFQDNPASPMYAGTRWTVPEQLRPAFLHDIMHTIPASSSEPLVQRDILYNRYGGR